MRRDSLEPVRMTCECPPGESPAWCWSFRSRCSCYSRSSRTRHGDFPGDDIGFDLLDTRVHRVRDERAIVLVVHVADTVLREAESVDAAFEGVILHALHHVEDGNVDSFDHRGEDTARCFSVLIGVDTD